MGFTLSKMDQFCLIKLIQNKIEVGIDIEGTHPYDKYPPTPPTPMINLRL